MSMMEPLEGDAPLPLPHVPGFSAPFAPPGSSQNCPSTLSSQQQQQQEPSSLGCGEAPAIDWASLFLPSSIGLQQPTPAGLLQSVERPSEGEGNATKVGGGGGCGKEKVKGGRAKKVSKPRFAFQTRSANDILDDGYRWRKYGQKAVKNSIYPRSYYRCTHHTCNVKKQVQRLSKDTSIVVTTYEGVHNHPCEKLMEALSPLLKQIQFLSRF
ncbi:uncharacterized protein [Elaeis guineensis]|uniref:uncharacterized protein n=1 Tax=Elaeis guineensis var. tenera TaxID=51953 RepID=UPI003C6D4D2B